MFLDGIEAVGDYSIVAGAYGSRNVQNVMNVSVTTSGPEGATSRCDAYRTSSNCPTNVDRFAAP